MGEHFPEHARVSRIEMRGRMGGKLAASSNATGNEATGQDHSDEPVTPPHTGRMVEQFPERWDRKPGRAALPKFARSHARPGAAGR